MDERLLYEVSLSDEAFFAFEEIRSDDVYELVKKNLKLLETSPHLGHIYDPVYEAARPPFECRVLFCWHYGIYHTVDDSARSVTIFAIEDQRRDPRSRFWEIDYATE